MRTQSDRAADFGRQAKPVFNVVIAYDDFEAGKHAVETCSRLVCDLQKHFDVRLKMWTFSLLRNNGVNAAAVKDAAEAPLVIIATASDDLSRAVRKWVELWAPFKSGQHATLAAVLTYCGMVDRC